MQRLPSILPKHLKMMRLYWGRDDRYYGDATACYRAVYNSDASQRVAQASAQRIMARPEIVKYCEIIASRAAESVGVDANFVLEGAVELYDRCMGNRAYLVTDEDGNTSEQRGFNPTVAGKALEIIGKHTQVQAFQDNVNHTHTHVLEDKLGRRLKTIEGRVSRTPRKERVPSAEVIENAAQDESIPLSAAAGLRENNI